MIQLWKLRRELIRMREDASARLGKLYEPLLKRRHDRWRSRQPMPQDQGVALTGKVAIFLIYQPKGVAPSILATLRWLVANGYAPLVVANAPLCDQDRSRVGPLAWRIFERPNFGYDFGGYRDGVLLLADWGIAPERLLILNDSVWLPTRPDSDLIARLEAVHADVAGGIEHPATVRRYGKMHQGHLESYLLLVNSRAWACEVFKSFWRHYPSSNKKMNAIREGERRFTSQMRDAGLVARGLFSQQLFLEQMAKQDDAFLRCTLSYASYVEPALEAEGKRLLTKDREDPSWRAAALQHIRRSVERRRFNACFAYPCDTLLGMDFMKKSLGSTGGDGASLHSRLRRQLLRAVAEGALPPWAPEVQAEMEAAEGRLGCIGRSSLMRS